MQSPPPLPPGFVSVASEAELRSLIKENENVDYEDVLPICSIPILEQMRADILQYMPPDCWDELSNAISQVRSSGIDPIFCNCTATVNPAIMAKFDCRPAEIAKWSVYTRYRACSAISTNNGVSIYLPPGTHLKLSRQIRCISNVKVTVASSGEGSTLDGQGETRLFYLSGGCSLTLRGLNLVNGRADRGDVEGGSGGKALAGCCGPSR